MRGTLAERFAAKIAPGDNGCVVWTASQLGPGYGGIWNGEKMELAHRVAWRLSGRALPAELDHVCENRLCVNVDHLRPLDHRANSLRSATSPTAINARKTHCPAGHAYEGDNLIVRAGHRGCRACRRERDSRRDRRRPDRVRATP